ncbi:MAG: hypothetical protein R3C49_23740 [Planctomycetaceae bacterium]
MADMFGGCSRKRLLNVDRNTVLCAAFEVRFPAPSGMASRQMSTPARASIAASGRIGVTPYIFFQQVKAIDALIGDPATLSPGLVFRTGK